MHVHLPLAALVALHVLLPIGAAFATPADPSNAEKCGLPGQWFLPGTSAQSQNVSGVIEQLANRQVVLLGESHDSAEDHRWQLHTLAQLHARRPQLALALEMFPRRLQSVLDRWVAGELSESDFLRQTDWDNVWGYDTRDYMPLFHFARMYRLPMIAMNVERTLVEAVARKGWDAVDEKEKEGLTRPAKPSADYQKTLRSIFERHPENLRSEPDFQRFTEAQATWDRGMAQAIAGQLKKSPETLVVGIVGAGHMRQGHGIAHQLRDLGITRTGLLMTWPQSDSCNEIRAGIADALLIVAPTEASPPRLGISMEQEKTGVRILTVKEGSLADKSGIKINDVIIEARGLPLRDMQALRFAVQQQMPGTWLPLKIKRGDEIQEIIVRFPVSDK